VRARSMAELSIHYPKTTISPSPLFHPLRSSTPITPGHHILVLPQKYNCSDPVSHWPSTGCHMMWSQRNTPTVLCGKHSAVWCVYQSSLFKLVDASMGTTRTGACMSEKQVIEGSPSVVGRSVLSSEKLFIQLLHCHALDSILTSAECRELL